MEREAELHEMQEVIELHVVVVRRGLVVVGEQAVDDGAVIPGHVPRRSLSLAPLAHDLLHHLGLAGEHHDAVVV